MASDEHPAGVAEGTSAGIREQRDRPADNRMRIRFRWEGPLIDVLRHLNCVLLVSTYQAGRLIAIGRSGDEAAFSFHAFNRAMGVAVRPGTVAVGSQDEVAFLVDTSQIAPLIEPEGRFDRLFLHRSSFKTGNIHGHEMAWVADGNGGHELWMVNTSFSCLCRLHDRFSFVPRWQPPFISELRPEDRCHLNGLGMRDGRPAVVTAMSETDVAGGWREDKNHTGLVFDIETGEVITHGLSMPHSPRLHRGGLYVLNSGHGQLERVDEQTGERSVVAQLPGFTRGLGLWGNIAFVGLSRVRETATFGGLPISERHDELECGLGAIDLDTGEVVARLWFESGIDEIFDVQILPAATCVSLGGEDPETGDRAEIWVIPPRPGEENTRLA